MNLYPDTMLSRLRSLPGAEHAFVKQLAHETGATDREHLATQVGQHGTDLEERWRHLLTCIDNRRFFQGYAELATATFLARSGWQSAGFNQQTETLLFQHPEGTVFDVLVTGFVQQRRPQVDREATERLLRALNRITARSRIAVVVRDWLPHNLDPEPVRQAVELWLTEVDRDAWEGRYAAFEDAHVRLEFGLTGGRAQPGDNVVLFQLGPFDAQWTIEGIESRLVFELERYRRTRQTERPMLAVCLSDQPLRVSPGHVRQMLYGKPRWMQGDGGDFEHAHPPEVTSSIFRDPSYPSVSAVVLGDRPLHRTAASLRVEAHLNPWCHVPLDVNDLDCAVQARAREEDGLQVIKWFHRSEATPTLPPTSA